MRHPLPALDGAIRFFEQLSPDSLPALARGHRDKTVPGVTHWQFDAHGRIVDHRDYWDPAHALYTHWPLLGALLRWLRRRLSAASPCV